MAIAIEGYTVVVLLSRADERLSGGSAALNESTPNATSLQDDHLWRCAFMAESDAQDFLQKLGADGLTVSTGPDPDAVIVCEFEQSAEPFCEWLRIAQWDKGVIAWLEGTTPQSVMAREGWSPEEGSGLQRHDASAENLEFLRSDGKIDVYLNKDSGEEVYLARMKPDPDNVFKTAADLITPNFVNPGDSALSGDSAETVRTAVEDLRPLLPERADSWRVHFLIGKGEHAIGRLDEALVSLRRAFEIEPTTEMVARELSGICLEAGLSDEAVRVAQKAVSESPDNAEILGNLACAQLIAAHLQKAEQTIIAALVLAPDDEVNRRVQAMITEVRDGQRPQPNCLGDLTGTRPAKRRKSVWERLGFRTSRED